MLQIRNTLRLIRDGRIQKGLMRGGEREGRRRSIGSILLIGWLILIVWVFFLNGMESLQGMES
jgi:hypothetical protein